MTGHAEQLRMDLADRVIVIDQQDQRHALPSWLWVLILAIATVRVPIFIRDRESARLTVTDDGCGFEIERTLEANGIRTGTASASAPRWWVRSPDEAAAGP
jgi:hypothetical protein